MRYRAIADSTFRIVLREIFSHLAEVDHRNADEQHLEDHVETAMRAIDSSVDRLGWEYRREVEGPALDPAERDPWIVEAIRLGYPHCLRCNHRLSERRWRAGWRVCYWCTAQSTWRLTERRSGYDPGHRDLARHHMMGSPAVNWQRQGLALPDPAQVGRGRRKRIRQESPAPIDLEARRPS